MRSTNIDQNSTKGSAVILYSPSSRSDIKAPPRTKALLNDCNPVARNASSEFLSHFNRLFKAAKGYIVKGRGDGKIGVINFMDTT